MKTRMTELFGIMGVIASGYKNARQIAYLANGFKRMRTATEDGDIEQGVLPVGQVQGIIHDEPTVAELLERMIREAKEVQGRVSAMMA